MTLTWSIFFNEPCDFTCPCLPFQDVMETKWYKKNFASTSCLEIETKHSLEVTTLHYQKKNSYKLSCIFYTTSHL